MPCVRNAPALRLRGQTEIAIRARTNLTLNLRVNHNDAVTPKTGSLIGQAVDMLSNLRIHGWRMLAVPLVVTFAIMILSSAYAGEPQCIAGTVNNSDTPGSPGSGIDGFWSYGGQFGIPAGAGMCAEIGADRLCSYRDLLAAGELGELALLPDGDYWLHRVDLAVEVNKAISPPGPGGRCNDWTTNTNHIADGEYFEVSQPNVTYHFDADTVYDGTAGHVQAGVDCHEFRAISCCLDTCQSVNFEDGFEVQDP